jgi:hypothetical protein
MRGPRPGPYRRASSPDAAASGDVPAGLNCHGQLKPRFTELLNTTGLHELRNRAIDHSNEADDQRGDRL